MNNERSYLKVKINEYGEIVNKEPFKMATYELKGQEVYICFIKNTEQRSKDQNKFFYGVVVPRVAELTGYTADETKELLQQTFLTITTPAGKRIVLKTSQLTINEFSEFLTNCINLITKFFRVNLSVQELENYERII